MPEAQSSPVLDATPNEFAFIVPSLPTTHYDKLDETIAAKSDADRISTLGANKTERFDMQDAPADVDEVTEITVKIFMKSLTAVMTPALRVAVRDASSEIAFVKLTSDTGGLNQVRLFTITGLSLSKAQADALVIEVQAVESAPGDDDSPIES